MDGLLQDLLLHGWTWWAGWWGCAPPKCLVASKWIQCHKPDHLHVSITNSCHEQGPLCRTFFLVGTHINKNDQPNMHVCLLTTCKHGVLYHCHTPGNPHVGKPITTHNAHQCTTHCLMMRFASWKHPFLKASKCASSQLISSSILVICPGLGVSVMLPTLP